MIPALLAGAALPYVAKVADEFILAPFKQYGKRFGKWITGDDEAKDKQPQSAFAPPNQAPTEPRPTERTPAFSTGGDQAVVNAGRGPVADGPPTPLYPGAGEGPEPSGSEFFTAMQDTMGQLHDSAMSDTQVEGWGPGEGEGKTSAIWGGNTFGGYRTDAAPAAAQGGSAFNPRTGQRTSPPMPNPIASAPGAAFSPPPPGNSLMPDQIAAGAAPGPNPVGIAAREPPMPSGGGLTQPDQSAGAVERGPQLSTGRSPGPMGGGGAAFSSAPTDSGPPPPPQSAFSQPAAAGPATSGGPQTAFAPPPAPGQKPGQPAEGGGGAGDPSIAVASAISNSPSLQEAVKNPTSVFPDPDKYINMMLKEGEFDSEVSNRISSMTRDEKSEMLLEMGLRMMVAGGQGKDPFAAFGTAGIGALDTFRANRGQQRQSSERRADRRANVYGKAAEITQQRTTAQERAESARERDATDRRGQDLAAQTAEANRASAERTRAAADDAAMARERVQAGTSRDVAGISASAPSQEQRTLEYMTKPKDQGGLGLTPEQAIAQSGGSSHDVRRDIAWYKAQQQALRKDDLSLATPEQRSQIDKEIDAEVDKVFGPGASGSAAGSQGGGAAITPQWKAPDGRPVGRDAQGNYVYTDTGEPYQPSK